MTRRLYEPQENDLVISTVGIVGYVRRRFLLCCRWSMCGVLGVYIYSSRSRGLRRWDGLGFWWLLEVSLSKLGGGRVGCLVSHKISVESAEQEAIICGV